MFLGEIVEVIYKIYICLVDLEPVISLLDIHCKEIITYAFQDVYARLFIIGLLKVITF